MGTNFRQLYRARIQPHLRDAVLGLILGVGGVIGRAALTASLPSGHAPFIVAFPAVAAAAMAAGLVGGLAATAVTSILGAFFLLAPEGSWEVEDTVGLVFFIAGGVLMSVLGGRFETSRKAAVAGRQRARLVADVSTLLSQRVDQGASLAALTNVVVPSFADWCVIDLFDANGNFDHAEIAAPDEATAALAQELRRRYPYEPDATMGIPAVFRTSEAEVVLRMPSGFMDVIPDPELRDIMRRLGLRSYISVPAIGPTGRRFGVLTVVMSTSGRNFSPDDVATTLDLGRRVGAALDTAVLVDEITRRAEELSVIIESIEDPVLVADGTERISTLNRAATAALGDVRGRSIDEVLAELPGVDANRATLAVPATGHFLRPVEVRTHAAGVPVRIAILRDVTELLEGETARDAFLGMLSHELRTPITTIYGSAQMLQRPIADETREVLIKDVGVEAERLHRLTEDLLVLSRFERGRLEASPEPILARRVIARVLKRVADTYPQLKVSLSGPADVAPIMADPTYLEQIIRNLLSNSMKYAGDAATVEIEIVRHGGSVEIDVEDDGPGIADSDLERVFGLYERLAGAALKPGAGVGLFVCRRLTEAMGGTIVARRGRRGGARFVIELPAAEGEEFGRDADAQPNDDLVVIASTDAGREAVRP
ncbi:MAG TPA: ATP-binding protein [Candidatus Limnocylindrales bacterium]|nr:ATP-binding protein [Candidatus Limnocylindrales bacterium]